MDPNNVHQMQQLGFAMIGTAILIGLLFTVFKIFLYWRIFTKAGMSGPLALIALFFGLGDLIVLCILAFGDWKVIPAPTASPYLPPSYPPPPAPAAYQPPPQA